MNAVSSSYRELTRSISAQVAALNTSQPAAMQGFRALSQGAMDAGALSAKTKELMALALGIAAHCEGCIGFHAKALAAMGANRAEIEEAIAVAVYMGGGPSLMYGASALEAYRQFAGDAGGTRQQ